MSIRAYAIVDDLGVMFADRQLLVFPRKADADKALVRLLASDLGEFDKCHIERIAIHRGACAAEAARADIHAGEN